jgi:hypothetical protein
MEMQGVCSSPVCWTVAPWAGDDTVSYIPRKMPQTSVLPWKASDPVLSAVIVDYGVLTVFCGMRPGVGDVARITPPSLRHAHYVVAHDERYN